MALRPPLPLVKHHGSTRQPNPRHLSIDMNQPYTLRPDPGGFAASVFNPKIRKDSSNSEIDIYADEEKNRRQTF